MAQQDVVRFFRKVIHIPKCGFKLLTITDPNDPGDLLTITSISNR